MRQQTKLYTPRLNARRAQLKKQKIENVVNTLALIGLIFLIGIAGKISLTVNGA